MCTTDNSTYKHNMTCHQEQTHTHSLVHLHISDYTSRLLEKVGGSLRTEDNVDWNSSCVLSLRNRLGISVIPTPTNIDPTKITAAQS